MSETIQSHQSPESVAAALASLPSVLAQSAPDPTGEVAGMYRALAEKALQLVQDDFRNKSMGGTGADGVKWPDIKAKTKAYSRDIPGLTRKHVGDRPRGLLSPSQDKRWRGIFAGVIRSLEGKSGKPGLTPFGNRVDREGNAAAIAWTILKAEGARTMIDVYGGQSVPILHNTGLLEGSFEIRIDQNGQASVVNTCPYAAVHHKGAPSRNLPARPIWPDDCPEVWQEQFADIMAQWAGAVLRRLAG